MTTKFSSSLPLVTTSQLGHPTTSTVTAVNLPTLDTTPVLTLNSVSRIFSGATTPAVNHVSLSLQPGELLGLLGPSGCGKTTLLRLIAGFDRPQSGQITLNGAEVAGNGAWIPPERRGLGMVFQDYALFPHLTVAKNVGFGLSHRRQGAFAYNPWSTAAKRKRVSEVLDLVGLSGMTSRYPHQLSGGQQQRVALARALAPNPPMVLLDEPLSNLDAKVRLQLRQELRNIIKSVGATGIFVTHDQEEALSVCDRVAVMCNGSLEQVGTPEELYCNPASRFIAEFIVQANFLPAHQENGMWATELGHISQKTVAEVSDLLGQHSMTHLDPVTDLMIRQENVSLAADTTSNVVVRDRQFLGRENRYCLQLPSGQTFHARVPAEHYYDVGTPVKVAIAPQTIQLFPRSSHKS